LSFVVLVPLIVILTATAILKEVHHAFMVAISVRGRQGMCGRRLTVSDRHAVRGFDLVIESHDVNYCHYVAVLA
jgi:hypothetical protein